MSVMHEFFYKTKEVTYPLDEKIESIFLDFLNENKGVKNNKVD